MRRFILRRASPEQRALGLQFSLVVASRPHFDPKAIAFSREGRYWLIETGLPIPGKRPDRIDVGPMALPRIRYRIHERDIALEGFD